MGFDNIVDSDKYVDFFGWSDHAGEKNAYINNMLDEVELRYYKPSMMDIMQVMIHSDGCSACETSIPLWEKMTIALQIRFREKYHHMMLEINEMIVIDGKQTTGGDLYKRFNAKGAPFFLQNFKITKLKRTKDRSNPILQIERSDWFKVTEGLLQPFEFLSTCFDVKNQFMESKIGRSNMFTSPF